jgi:hypothetical protein
MVDNVSVIFTQVNGESLENISEHYFKMKDESGFKYRDNCLLSYGTVARGDNMRG